MAKDVLTKVAAPGQVINVQPGHGTAGRHPTRAFLDALSGHEDPGMFGRMFPTLTPLAVDDTALTELANAMRDADPGSETGNNLSIPAGFTYLGQFVDHDITLDLTSLGDKEADPTAVENFRTPALDLDSVYGLGPDGSRQLYARNPADADGKTPGPKLLIGRTINVPLGDVTGDSPERPAPQPGRLRLDRRSSQRREPGGGADASRDAEVPQQGLRPARVSRQAAGRRSSRRRVRS